MPNRNVSFRAVLLALLITIPNSYWLMINWGTSGYSTGQSFPTVSTVYFNVIFVVLILMAVNPLLRTLRKNASLTDAELMVVYLLVSIASSIAGHDTLQILWPLLTYPIWFDSPENEWGELFHRHMPDWLTIKGTERPGNLLSRGRLTSYSATPTTLDDTCTLVVCPLSSCSRV